MSVRILFAMARDNNLPAGDKLTSVSGTRRVPVIPAVPDTTISSGPPGQTLAHRAQFGFSSTGAKANGFDVKALRTIVRLRKQDADDRREQEAILETYMHALGMLK